MSRSQHQHKCGKKCVQTEREAIFHCLVLTDLAGCACLPQMAIVVYKHGLMLQTKHPTIIHPQETIVRLIWGLVSPSSLFHSLLYLLLFPLMVYGTFLF